VIELAPTLRVFQKVGDNFITYFACANDEESLSCDSSFIVILLPHRQARGPPRVYKIILPLEERTLLKKKKQKSPWRFSAQA